MFFIAIVLVSGLSKVEAFSSDHEKAEMHKAEVLLIQEGHIRGESSSPVPVSSIGLLSDSDTQLYDNIYNGLVNSAAEINISKYNVTDKEILRQTYTNIINDNSSLFYVTGGYSYYTLGGKITSILPDYSMSGAELIAEKEEYRSSIEAITSLVDPSWSPMEIALFLHDYLILHYEYDESYSIYSANEFFKSKKGVCNAYTLAYQALLDEFGFERTRALSDKSAMNHIWNVVKINEEWYHVDVTWDDPVPDKLGYIRHLFFLVSDEAIQDTNRYQSPHFGWESPVACTDGKYDYYSWIDITAPFTYLDGQWYAISSTGLAIYDPILGVLENDLIALPKWRVWDQPTCSWSGKYSGLGVYGGEVYYNSPEEIYAYDPVTDSTRSVYSPDCTNGYIYGIKIAGSRIEYLISKGPNPVDMQHAEIRAYNIPRIESGIRIESLPNKTVYEINESIDLEGMVVMLDYNNGDSEPIDDYAISGDLSSLGKKTITVSYGGYTDSFTFTVCGLSVVDKGDGSYQASFVLEAQEGGTSCLISGHEANGRMKAVKTLPFAYEGGFVTVQATLNGIEEWSILKVYLLDNLFNPKTISQYFHVN